MNCQCQCNSATAKYGRIENDEAMQTLINNILAMCDGYSYAFLTELEDRLDAKFKMARRHSPLALLPVDSK